MEFEHVHSGHNLSSDQFIDLITQSALSTDIDELHQLKNTGIAHNETGAVSLISGFISTQTTTQKENAMT
ncbi:MULTISPECIES: hypothetical protein [Vibrio]|uniref:hypothetical protein n=1 Tax=Vibrio TaxID=662 RepID=UPI001E40C38C|nr:hypothetical protein [Vibrio lentus]MCC4837987.1 hypothetical protein [Vibrio lentus]